MPEPLLEEVFKISGVPTVTFVEPSQFGELKVGLRSPGRGLVIEGPSGIGKSTAVSRALAEVSNGHGRTTALSARDPGDIGYIELLPEMTDFGVVILDDFHVLDDNIRSGIADLLKRLADTESATSKLIVIGINRAGDSLIEHAPDLANRIDTIRFEVEPAPKVRQLIEAGEEALNIRLESRDRIIKGRPGELLSGAATMPRNVHRGGRY
jgi:hypothetical protein